MRVYRQLMISGVLFALLLILVSCSSSTDIKTEEPSEGSTVSLTSEEDQPSDNTTEELPAETDYLTLSEPDQIRAYYGDEEYVFTAESQIFKDIYAVIEQGWEDAKNPEGTFPMLLMTHMDQAPEDTSRIVLEYDREIRWQLFPDAPETAAGMNTYVYFLNWNENCAVICKDQKWGERAFFPKVFRSGKTLGTIMETYVNANAAKTSAQ